MTLGEGWQLMKIRGIPLRIHPTWFAILLVVTLAAHSSYSAQFSSSVGICGHLGSLVSLRVAPVRIGGSA